MKLLITDEGRSINIDMRGRLVMSIEHYNNPSVYQLSKAFAEALERTDIETLTNILNEVKQPQQA